MHARTVYSDYVSRCTLLSSKLWSLVQVWLPAYLFLRVGPIEKRMGYIESNLTKPYIVAIV